MSLEYSNECCILLTSITKKAGLLIRVGDSLARTPAYYYISDEATLKRLDICPITREVTYAYLKLSDLSHEEFNHLLASSAPNLLKEQEELRVAPALTNFNWQFREFGTHREITTWSGIHSASLRKTRRVRVMKEGVNFFICIVALAAIVFIPGVNVIYFGFGGFLLGSLIFGSAVNKFCTVHEGIRERSLQKLRREVFVSHAEVLTKHDTLSADKISTVIHEYQKPIIKRYSFLLSIITFGLVSKHQSRSSSVLLAQLQSDFFSAGDKKRVIKSYLADQKNYGKRLFCCLTRKVSQNISDQNQEVKPVGVAPAYA